MNAQLKRFEDQVVMAKVLTPLRKGVDAGLEASYSKHVHNFTDNQDLESTDHDQFYNDVVKLIFIGTYDITVLNNSLTSSLNNWCLLNKGQKSTLYC